MAKRFLIYSCGVLHTLIKNVMCVHTYTTVHGKEKEYTKILVVIISKLRDFLIYTFLFYFFFHEYV